MSGGGRLQYRTQLQQIEARAQAQGLTFEEAKVDLVQEKQSLKDFVAP
jgi:hypothetical protein